MTFFDGATSLGSRNLASGKASLTTSGLGFGTHRLTARYIETSTNAASTSPPLGQTIRHLATVRVSASARQVKPLERLTLTANVASASGVPVGSVSFMDGTRKLATIALSNGGASFTTPALPYGRHAISAVYNGSGVHLKASSPSTSVLVTYAIGAQTKVNITPALSTARPIATGLANGTAAIVWESQQASGEPVGIVARRMSKTGVLSAVELHVAAPAAGIGSPHIVGLTNGDFVIVWHGGVAGRRNIFARTYTSTGVPRSPAFLVNTAGAGDNLHPRVAPLANGAFLVTWQGMRADASGYGILARRFNANRSPSASQFRVNATENGNQLYPTPLQTANGNLVIAWIGAVSGGHSAFFQLFQPAGNRIGPERRVNAEPMAVASRIASAPLANGAFALAWSRPDTNTTSPTDVYWQRFLPTGQQIGASVRINIVTPGRQQDVALATITGNNLVAAWTGIDSGPPVTPGIEAHVLRSTGARVSMPFHVSTSTNAVERYPAIALYNSGLNYLIAWSVQTPSQPGQVYMQRFTGTLHDSVHRPTRASIGNGADARSPQ